MEPSWQSKSRISPADVVRSVRPFSARSGALLIDVDKFTGSTGKVAERAVLRLLDGFRIFVPPQVRKQFFQVFFPPYDGSFNRRRPCGIKPVDSHMEKWDFLIYVLTQPVIFPEMFARMTFVFSESL